MDREKEREIELESAMYTNCLLLGLDPSIIGVGAGNSTPRVGLFRHSNPKLGEQLLYFILSSLRGPAQSAKVFLSFCQSIILRSVPICVFDRAEFVFFSNCLRSRRISTRFGRFSIPHSLAIFGRLIVIASSHLFST